MIGADFAKETEHFTFFNALSEGTVPVDQNDVVLGQAMARNLGVGLGKRLLSSVLKKREALLRWY